MSSKKRLFVIGVIIALICFTVAAASCSKQQEPEAEDPAASALETDADDADDEIDDDADDDEDDDLDDADDDDADDDDEDDDDDRDGTGFVPYDSADEEVVLGDVRVGDLFEELRKLRRAETDGLNWDHFSIDISEYCQVRGESAAVCYTFRDLNGDGSDELLFGDENGIPLCIYMVKNGVMHVPELVYYRAPNAVSSDGVINTMQGNGVPDDAHKNGYFFRIDPSAPDGIVETEPGSDEPMQFDWKLFR